MQQDRRTPNESLLYAEIDELKKLNSNLADVYKQSMADLREIDSILSNCYIQDDGLLFNCYKIKVVTNGEEYWGVENDCQEEVSRHDSLLLALRALVGRSKEI